METPPLSTGACVLEKAVSVPNNLLECAGSGAFRKLEHALGWEPAVIEVSHVRGVSRAKLRGLGATDADIRHTGRRGVD